MTRRQILRPLREEFTAEELQIINSNEKVLRRSISKILNSVGSNTIVSGTKETPDIVEETATAIAQKIWPKEEPNYNSKIYQKIQNSIAELLAKPKYVTDCSVILNDLNKKASLAKELRSKKIFRLSEIIPTDFDSKTKEFLMDLYDIKLSFGGGNTIGAGELCFAATFSDTDLCNHTSNNNKYDLLLSTNGSLIGIEIKADGGRLDGSGMKAFSVKIKELAKALKEAIKLNADLPDEDEEPEESDVYEKLKKLLEVGSSNCIERNPFSRQSIKTFWFGELPRSLAIMYHNDTGVIRGILTDFVDIIYSKLVYQGLGANQAYIQEEDINKIADLCLSYCNSNQGTEPNTTDTEMFVMLDTFIRSHTYMGVYRDEKTTGQGYLLFTKDIKGDLLCKVIDYTGELGQAEQDWKDGKFKITPGNDDRRAAPVIHVTDTPTSVNEKRRRLRSRGLRESYISRHR